jgi:hypothetical protein
LGKVKGRDHVENPGGKIMYMKIYFREIVCEVGKWIELAHDTVV